MTLSGNCSLNREDQLLDNNLGTPKKLHRRKPGGNP